MAPCFADYIFRCILVNEKICILMRILWVSFLSVQLTIAQHWFTVYGLVPKRQHAIIWTNADPIPWRIYAALGGDKSTFGKVMPLHTEAHQQAATGWESVDPLSARFWAGDKYELNHTVMCQISCIVAIIDRRPLYILTDEKGGDIRYDLGPLLLT